MRRRTLANDARLLERSGLVVVAADVAAELGSDDVDGKRLCALTLAET